MASSLTWLCKCLRNHMLMIVQAGDYWHAWMWLLLWYDLAKICAIIWNDCAIKLCKHMNWLCNVITPIWAKHIEHPPSGYTLNMEAFKAWLSKHLCNHQMIVHSYCANSDCTMFRDWYQQSKVNIQHVVTHQCEILKISMRSRMGNL